LALPLDRRSDLVYNDRVNQREVPMVWTIEMVSLQHDGAGWSFNDCYGREEITLPDDATDRIIVIAAKKLYGWTGSRCYRETIGEGFRLRAVGTTMAIDIMPNY
jgi:hypothetical protein